MEDVLPTWEPKSSEDHPITCVAIRAESPLPSHQASQALSEFRGLTTPVLAPCSFPTWGRGVSGPPCTFFVSLRPLSGARGSVLETQTPSQLGRRSAGQRPLPMQTRSLAFRIGPPRHGRKVGIPFQFLPGSLAWGS